MKGIIFNLLEQVVSGKYGEETWDSLLDAAGVEGSYTAVGSYPDEDLFGLVGAASAALSIPADDLIRWFGRSAMPLLAGRYPQFFEGHPSTRSFILTLNEVIHPEVRKLFPGAYAPEFRFDVSREDRLGLEYVSRRRLCSLAEGLIEGAADHFGEEVTIVQERCAKRGDEGCLLVCTFKKLAGVSTIP